MKLVDANLLLYATNPSDPHHQRAAAWFDELMNSGERVALPWHSLIAFVRVSTSTPSRKEPLPMAVALDFVRDWLEWESVWVPEPTANHFSLIFELLQATPRTKLVSDAHLAAMAIGHGLTLCSADIDFRLFKGLRLLNPLE